MNVPSPGSSPGPSPDATPDATPKSAPGLGPKSTPGAAPDPTGAPGPARGASPLAAALLAAIALELLARLTGAAPIQHAGWAALGLAVALSIPRLGLREGYLLVMCGALAALAFVFAEAPGVEIGAALDQAGFLLAFILLIGLLHEAASSSPAVAACGGFLTRQPPGRRYYALNGGSALLAVLFNVGVVSFLVPLIQRGIERTTPGDARNPVRERRQISALLRGFAWCVIWSPTAVAPIAVAALIPGVDRQLWMIYGFGAFLAVMVLGAAEDRWRHRHLRPGPAPAPMPTPWAAFARFAAACGWLFGMTALVVWLTQETVIFGLLMACPPMLVGWLLVQNGFPRARAVRPTASRLRMIMAEGLPRSAPVAITLACSGFIGRAGASLVPAQALAAALHLDAIPDFALLALIPAALALLGLLAVSPIMMAIFFGSLFGALPVLPADPTLLAFSISCGWALSMTFSPFATVVLLINRVGGVPARRLTWEWNLGFTALAAAMMWPLFWVLTGGA
jgi:hypothetical protein